jgi:PhnB protein
MAGRINEDPQGFQIVTPYLIVTDGVRAIDSYGWALGAEEFFRVDGPDGKVAHAEIKIDDRKPNWGKRSREMLEKFHGPEGLQANGGGLSWLEQRSGKDLSISGKWMCP